VSKKVVEIEGKRLTLSNLEKILYPSYSFTKADVLHYYHRISSFILPHLRDRALTFKRYPEGAESEFFFEKRCPSHSPAWVKKAEISLNNKERMRVCVVNDPGTLLWAANLASLELHVPMGRTTSPEIADSMVFDLDPGKGADLLNCVRVALILRELLSHMHLSACVKSSGKKGLHLFVPLNDKNTTFDETKRFSRAAAEIMQKNYPNLVTSKMPKEFRKDKVFINWSQNDSSKTMVSVYSLRAGEQPTVSCPLSWQELEDAGEERNPEKLRFVASDVVRRAEEKGDLFRDMLSQSQKLPHM
jgi:bifunctional non-homologous end joining protein LigD